jgi:hypothetical protein
MEGEKNNLQRMSMIATIRAMKTHPYAPSLRCFDPSQMMNEIDKTPFMGKAHKS